MAGTALIGTGATIAFGTSSYSVEVTNCNRPAIDTTHLGTTNARTFRPGDLYDGGQVEVDIHYDPDDHPPISGAEETITITFDVPSGLTNGATAQFTGFIIETGIENPLEDKVTGSYTIKVADEITRADAS